MIAGLLHDIVEDTPVGFEEVTARFGTVGKRPRPTLLRGEARRTGPQAAVDRSQTGPPHRAGRSADRKPARSPWRTSFTT